MYKKTLTTDASIQDALSTLQNFTAAQNFHQEWEGKNLYIGILPMWPFFHSSVTSLYLWWSDDGGQTSIRHSLSRVLFQTVETECIWISPETAYSTKKKPLALIGPIVQMGIAGDGVHINRTCNKYFGMYHDIT